ncbi:MAG: hypothetical protein KKE20_05745 [Nanoarchaeota archaeon]|nr:hypothetical protein [Nanoarchaeota archaeon]
MVNNIAEKLDKEFKDHDLISRTLDALREPTDFQPKKIYLRDIRPRLNDMKPLGVDEKGPFIYRGTYNSDGDLEYKMLDDISWRHKSFSLRQEVFRISGKSRYSFRLDDPSGPEYPDGTWIPFATVKRKERLIRRDQYEVHVEILPCMIPDALKALAQYAQDSLLINGPQFSDYTSGREMAEIKAIQKELYAVHNQAIIERRDKRVEEREAERRESHARQDVA